MSNKYKIFIDLIDNATKPLKDMNRVFDSVRQSTSGYTKSLKSLTASLGVNSQAAERVKKSWGEIPSLMAGAFAIGQVTNFGKEVVNTLAEFERYEAVLTNTLGSNSSAKKALEDITAFANTTPFQINELSDSFVKLANQNFTPTMQEMTKLGDLAASTGKSFDMLAEAFLDAKTMEFERLKEFGITASKNSKKGTITFNFKNQATEIEATDKAIKEYLLSLGELEGVQGAAAAISKTTGGQLSNLAGEFTELKLEIGTALKPVISFAIIQLQDFIATMRGLVGWLEQNTWALKALGVVVGALGARFAFLAAKFLVVKVATIAYKTVVLALNAALMAGRLAVLAFNGILLLLNGGLAVVRTAMIAFNVVVLANPIGLIITAVAALIGGLVMLANKFPAIGDGLKGFFDSVVYWFGKAKDFIYNVFIAPVVEGIGMVKGLLGFAQEEDAEGNSEPVGMGGAAQGIGALQAAQPPIPGSKQQGDPVQKTGAFGGLIENQMWNAIDRGGKKQEPARVKLPQTAPAQKEASPKTVDGGGAGGRQGMSINNLTLVQELNIHTTSMSESPAKIKEMMNKVFLELVNNLNYAT